MAFFRKKKLSDGKWHPLAVSMLPPATIDDVADELSARSTVSRSDTYAVLVELGDVLGRLMATGRTVKLKGIGTFYYTADATKQGVDTPEEVSSKQIVGVRVRFLPETTRTSSGKVDTRSLVAADIQWNDIATLDPALRGGTTTTPGGEDEEEGGSTPGQGGGEGTLG